MYMKLVPAIAPFSYLNVIVKNTVMLDRRAIQKHARLQTSLPHPPPIIIQTAMA